MMETSSPTKQASPRQLAAAAADLLDQGAVIDRLSRPITIAALLGLIVGLGIELGALLTAGLLFVSLAGLIETYLALRVGFDAALFRRLEQGEADGMPDLGTLDAALAALGLLPRSKVARSVEQRALGARRLLTLQGAALALQVAIILLATAIVQAHVS